MAKYKSIHYRFLWIAPCLLICAFQAYANVISVEDAINMMYENNDELHAKKSQFFADKEQLNQSWSMVKPQVSFSATKGYGEYNTSTLNDQNDNYSRVRLSLTQPIYSRKSFKTIERAERFIEASEADLKLDMQVKMLETLGAYFELLQLKESSQLIKQEFNENKTSITRIEKMLKLGLASKMDQLEANSRHDELRSNLVKSESDVSVSLKRLEILIGHSIEDIENIDISLWKRANIILKRDNWHELAQKKSPIVKVAESQYGVASLDVDIEKSGHWPEINLKAGLSKTESYTTNIENDSTIELELTVPIYSGGGVSSRVTGANHVLKSREFTMKDQLKFVTIKLDEVLSTLSASVASIQALELSIESSIAYQNAAERGLNYGLRDVFDVLEAKSQVYQSQKRLNEQIFTNIMSQFEFLYLTGQLTPESIALYLKPDYNFSSMN